MASRRADAGQLAKRERCTERQINLTLSLAFLSPQLVKAAVEGRLPRGINIVRLRDPTQLGPRNSKISASTRTERPVSAKSKRLPSTGGDGGNGWPRIVYFKFQGIRVAALDKAP